MQINKNEFLLNNNPFLMKNNQKAEEKREAKVNIINRDSNHVMSVARRGESEFDGNMEAMRKKVRDIMDSSAEATKDINLSKEAIQNSKEYYGVADDSQEQKDLDILVKREARQELTEEENERLSQMGPLTEYQKEAMSFHKTINKNTEQLAINKDNIGNVARAMRQSLVNHSAAHEMLDAQQEKEDIIKNGSKELVDMMLEETKETIDEKSDEIKEEAEEKAEAKEEEEKRLEEAEADKTPQEKQAVDNQKGIDKITEAVIGEGQETEQIQTQTMDMNMKLIEEDMKGLAVDKKL